MGKVKTKKLKSTMVTTFLVTTGLIAVLSALTVFAGNQLQKGILEKRNLTISSPDFQIDEVARVYVLNANNNNIIWEPLSIGDQAAYYGSYAAMFGLPFLYTLGGIGVAATAYYRRKLRTPIAQLQNGVEKIQKDNLDFHIEYSEDDELGQLCRSMEKMRSELRKKHKALWESLEQGRLLNASVAHDIRTPITVLKGYLEYLEKGIPQGFLTEEMLMDTVGSMQGAVNRLERYVESVQNLETIQEIDCHKKTAGMKKLLREVQSNVRQMETRKEILVSGSFTENESQLDPEIFFRILENLLQNALRFSAQQVWINISQKENFLVLTVEDDGPGFSEKDLEEAVSAFYSSDRGNQHFGIGLSICRVLCEKHGGDLHLANSEKGARVTARLKIS